MKSGLASMLGAVAILRELELPKAGRVLVSLVPDEETGGRLGTAYLSGGTATSGGDSLGMLYAGGDQRRRVERQPGRA